MLNIIEINGECRPSCGASTEGRRRDQHAVGSLHLAGAHPSTSDMTMRAERTQSFTFAISRLPEIHVGFPSSGQLRSQKSSTTVRVRR